MSENKVEVLVPPLKSENDKKDYRLIKLQNGLKALLIRKVDESSKDELLAVANLTVGVGSFDEPKNISGLARLLSQTLFTEADNNSVEQSSNAESEYTSYYFEVPENVFPQTLDQFAQHFKSQTIPKGSISQQREKIDYDFKAIQSEDLSRITYFNKTFINEDHPASFLNFLSPKTLKDDITDDELYDAVLEFLNKYVANNMFLSVQSSRPLDELQQLVVDQFSAIKSGEIASKPNQSVDEIFKPEFYNKIYFIKPLRVHEVLCLSWVIDSVEQHYKCLPLNYLAHVFDNRSEGGLRKYLEKKNLARRTFFSIGSATFENNSMFAIVKLVVVLTDFGFENTEKVLEAIFSYLLMIKESPVEEHRRLFDEHKEKNEIDFKFQNESYASETVQNGSLGMKYFDNANILRSHSVPLEFDEKVITTIINALNERKFSLAIVSPRHKKFELKEKYFGIEYDEQDFPESYQKLWDNRQLKPEFFLEKPNLFLAKNFEILVNEEESTKFPLKILESDKIEVWHNLDNKFKIPKAFVYVNIISPSLTISAYNAIHLDFFKMLILMNIEKKFTSATSVGHEIYLLVEQKGIEIRLSGLNDKIQLFIEKIVKVLKHLPEDITEDIFETRKAEFKKYFTIFRPGDVLMQKVLLNEYWTDLEKLNQIDKMSFETMRTFLEKFYRKTKIQVLIQGNMLRAQANEIVRILEAELTNEPLGTDQSLKVRGYQMPLGSNVLRVKLLMAGNATSEINIFYEVGSYTIQNDCLLLMLHTKLNSLLSDYFENISYLDNGIVFGSSDGNVLGLNLSISSQEGKISYSEVLEKIEIFINEVSKKAIEGLTDEDFENAKQEKIKELISKYADVSHEVDRNWTEIRKRDAMFNRKEVMVETLKTLTKLELQEFFKSITQPGNMRKLSVQVIGNKEGEEVNEDYAFEFITEKLSDDENLITNIEEFQRTLLLH